MMILGVKSTDYHLERGWLVTEPRGNFSHGTILDEESSQCFVPTVKSQLCRRQPRRRIPMRAVLSINCFPSSRWPELTIYGKRDKVYPKPKPTIRRDDSRYARSRASSIGFEHAQLRVQYVKNTYK